MDCDLQYKNKVKKKLKNLYLLNEKLCLIVINKCKLFVEYFPRVFCLTLH